MPSLDPDAYNKQLAGKTPTEIFTTIYEKKLWGGRLSFGFHSGNGSRDSKIVKPYIAEIRKLLIELNRPSVLDLGCGDFRIGRHLVDYATPLIACDIVAPVIEANRRKYPGVEFKVIDAIEGDLPNTDVVLVRQVLQHLSNEQISKILPKLTKFKLAVITEHVPSGDFIANRDQLAGPDDRASHGSGIVLDKPPFNFRAADYRTICEVHEFGGIIRTNVFIL
jgi:SAM-dependent methyltransferase